MLMLALMCAMTSLSKHIASATVLQLKSFRPVTAEFLGTVMMVEVSGRWELLPE